MSGEALVQGSGSGSPPTATVTANGSRSFFRKKIADTLLGIVLPLLILAVWEIIARMHIVKPVFLPPPGAVAIAFYDMLVNQNLFLDFQASILTVIQGFLFGGILGILMGIWAGLSNTVERFFGPTLNGIRQIPPLAWLPLIILWIGIGNLAKVVIIAKTVFFPIFLNTLQGIRSVPREYVEVARIFEFGRFRLLREVILPAASPSIFVGIRYGAGLSWAMIVAAEMVSGMKGLGYLLLRAQDLLLTADLFVVMVIIGGVGFIIDAAIRGIENHFLRWKKNFNG